MQFWIDHLAAMSAARLADARGCRHVPVAQQHIVALGPARSDYFNSLLHRSTCRLTVERWAVIVLLFSLAWSTSRCPTILDSADVALLRDALFSTGIPTSLPKKIPLTSPSFHDKTQTDRTVCMCMEIRISDGGAHESGLPGFTPEFLHQFAQVGCLPCLLSCASFFDPPSNPLGNWTRSSRHR